MAKSSKQAKYANAPVLTKRPIVGEPPSTNEPLSWRFSKCDRAGPYNWHFDEDRKLRETIDRLNEFETKNWQQILSTGSHPIEVNKLSDAARRRLVEIRKDDIDELMSFRIKGRSRVWAEKNGNVMNILWWDEHHAVCPVLPDRKDRVKARRRRGI